MDYSVLKELFISNVSSVWYLKGYECKGGWCWGMLWYLYEDKCKDFVN